MFSSDKKWNLVDKSWCTVWPFTVGLHPGGGAPAPRAIGSLKREATYAHGLNMIECINRYQYVFLTCHHIDVSITSWICIKVYCCKTCAHPLQMSLEKQRVLCACCMMLHFHTCPNFMLVVATNSQSTVLLRYLSCCFRALAAATRALEQSIYCVCLETIMGQRNGTTMQAHHLRLSMYWHEFHLMTAWHSPNFKPYWSSPIPSIDAFALSCFVWQLCFTRFASLSRFLTNLQNQPRKAMDFARIQQDRLHGRALLCLSCRTGYKLRWCIYASLCIAIAMHRYLSISSLSYIMSKYVKWIKSASKCAAPPRPQHFPHFRHLAPRGSPGKLPSGAVSLNRKTLGIQNVSECYVCHWPQLPAGCGVQLQLFPICSNMFIRFFRYHQWSIVIKHVKTWNISCEDLWSISFSWFFLASLGLGSVLVPFDRRDLMTCLAHLGPITWAPWTRCCSTNGHR